MNILHLIANNARHSPMTLRFPERVPPPDHLRGMVSLTPESCTTCGTCAYVCSPGAIRLSDDGSVCDWVYDAGGCTFCGRCADYCPTGAIALQAERPPVYTAPGALRQILHIPFPRCPLCGRPAHPVKEIILARAFDQVNDTIRARSQWCDSCRQRNDPLVAAATGDAIRSRSDGP